MNFNIVAFEDVKEMNFAFVIALKANHALTEVFPNVFKDF